MDLLEFFSLNIIVLGFVGIATFVYLVMLIKKRKKKDFLHEQKKK